MSTSSSASLPARIIDPEDRDARELYFLLNSLVVPRPIAWVATRSASGVANLAPHSYFTIASTAPPALAFTSIGDKDTVTNIRETGALVIHVVDHALVQQMNDTAANAPSEVSEFALAGLASRPASLVQADIVEAAAVAIECELDRIVEVGNGRMVIAQCRRFHVAERVWDERDRVAPERLDAVARMGGASYATTRDRFELNRVTYEELTAAR
jgi:flavin reductase (DIM6/NTAB) family NADH-FMN oxidoreductase RutF